MAAHLLLPDGSGSYDSGLYPVHGQLLHFLSGGICNEPVFWVHSVFIELPLWCDRAGLYVCLHLSPVFCLYSAVCGNPVSYTHLEEKGMRSAVLEAAAAVYNKCRNM